MTRTYKVMVRAGAPCATCADGDDMRYYTVRAGNVTDACNEALMLAAYEAVCRATVVSIKEVGNHADE